MKRFLAILLCASLLFAAGSSEAASCKLSWNADTNGVQQWLINAGVSEAAAAQLASPAADLMNALSCEVEFKDWIPVFLSLQLQNQTMLSVSSAVSDTGKCLLQSNLFSGITLQTENPFLQLQEAAVISQLSETVSGWFAKLDCRQEKGSFIGDAYTGGTSRYTWEITDAQLIELLRSVSVSFGINLSDFDFLLSCLADSNGTVQVALVTDTTDTLVGISITLLDGSTTLATLSVHPGSESFTAVLGYRFHQKLWYHTLQFTYAEENHLTASIDSRCTLQAMDYAALKSAMDPVNHLELTVSVSDAVDQLTLSAVNTLNGTRITCLDTTLDMDGLTAVISSGKDKVTAWTFRMLILEDKTSSLVTEGTAVLDMTSIGLTEEDTDLFSSALSDSIEQL